MTDHPYVPKVEKEKIQSGFLSRLHALEFYSELAESRNYCISLLRLRNLDFDAGFRTSLYIPSQNVGTPTISNDGKNRNTT
ncbi:hypothetical protein QMM42_07220 [Leptospira santarosai]|uniref:hypothetical protein n=1 Tax=Leptospira santarosai TaxID=28183 RepID=UPI00031F4584|nr:hypothetical protein [Leptospira santarosai]MDI7156926.1 hypothetical protein [Leptospira santarosai]MDI7185996.1 hypothetical protein [Leptospira santarosai]MDI7190490.1 hypothetical protein [Leptospira santarosai]MDI7201515.1 hypothetical protein [Leptospira santarosai]MDI7208122.1 hypothetical protein [Leptospira santarosai]